jgi:hypothetical protein
MKTPVNKKEEEEEVDDCHQQSGRYYLCSGRPRRRTNSRGTSSY